MSGSKQADEAADVADRARSVDSSAHPSTPVNTERVVDDALFETWVVENWDVLKRVAVRLCADNSDDALQAALASAWRYRRKFDPARGTPRAWLLGIVANEARRSHWRPALLVALSDSESSHADLEHDLRIDLEMAIRRLKRAEKQVVDLHYFVGLSVAEVASCLNIRPSRVKTLLTRARAKIAQSMKGYSG